MHHHTCNIIYCLGLEFVLIVFFKLTIGSNYITFYIILHSFHCFNSVLVLEESPNSTFCNLASYSLTNSAFV